MSHCSQPRKAAPAVGQEWKNILNGHHYRVLDVRGSRVTIVSRETGNRETVHASDLIASAKICGLRATPNPTVPGGAGAYGAFLLNDGVVVLEADGEPRRFLNKAAAMKYRNRLWTDGDYEPYKAAGRPGSWYLRYVGPTTPNPRVDRPGNDRDFAAKTIQSALRRRSHVNWTVKVGRGTARGWLTIDAPPKLKGWHFVLPPGAADYPENYIEAVTGKPYGHMGPHLRKELAELLSLDRVHHQGVNIPGQHDFYEEYMDRANGAPVERRGVPDWTDNPRSGSAPAVGSYWQRHAHPQHLARVTATTRAAGGAPPMIALDVVTGRGQSMGQTRIPLNQLLADYSPLETSSPYRKTLPNPRAVPAESLKVGDVVMPPSREVRLWMLRAAAEKGLAEGDLGIMLTDIHEGAPDKRGRWLVFTGYLRDAWYAGGKQHPFKFKARPKTPWPVAAHPVHTFKDIPERTSNPGGFGHRAMNRASMLTAAVMGASDAELDNMAHNGKTKRLRDAAKRELKRRGAVWSGAGVADRAMGRTANPKITKASMSETKRRAFRAAFPDYPGRKYRTEARESIYVDTTWGGGSRQLVRFVRLDNMQVYSPPDMFHAGPQTVAIPPGAVAVTWEHFQGKDMGLTMTIPPHSNAAIQNPRGGGDLENAKRVFEMWSELKPTRVRKMKGPSRIPKAVAEIGELVSVVYRSKKYDGKSRLYEHKTKSPRPVLAATPDGQHVLVVGGKMKITPDGLVN